LTGAAFLDGAALLAPARATGCADLAMRSPVRLGTISERVLATRP
jgi:hypothetical protein